MEKNSSRRKRNTYSIWLPAQRMLFADALAAVESSDAFAAWKRTHPKGYLVHGFCMLDEPDSWQVGFYDATADKVTVFTVKAGTVAAGEASEAMKETGSIKELKRDELAFSSDDALERASDYRKATYPGHEVAKGFVVLQHIAAGQVWNVSYFTKTYSLCNIKLDTASGDVVDSSCESLLGWDGARVL